MSQQFIPLGETGTGPDRDGKDAVPKAADPVRLLRLLDERLRFEGLLARLSTTFINLPAEAVDGQIEFGLRQVVECLGVDRGSVGQFSADGGAFTVTHTYSVPGVPHFPLTDLAARWPWYTEQIRRGRVLRLARIPEDLPPEAVRELQTYPRDGLRSHVVVPLKVGDAVLGGIGVATFRRQRDWPEDQVQSLQLLGEIFANALARKRADLVLRESEGRFRRMTDTAPVLVWMSGLDRRCTYFNRPWLDFTGRPLHSQLGDGWTEGVHPEDLPRCLHTYLTAFDARQDFRMEYRLRRSDGEYRWVLDTGVPRFEADGTFAGYIGSCIDISDRVRAEGMSRGLREQLARVGRVNLLGELVASIAHEVNQPLCAIVSNAQAVQRMLTGGGYFLDELLETLRDVVRDSQRAGAVIARTRALLQKQPPEHATVDVNGLIREVAELTRGEMARRGVTLTLELAEALPAVTVERIQLQQVILNLLTNGADAMDRVEGARDLVVRSAADAAGGVAVAVGDAGVGIAPDDLRRVFDPFYTTKPGGMGMGLAICKSIVEAHGGRLTAVPNARRGTTIQFTLPATRGERP